jgi:hypothetical protein
MYSGGAALKFKKSKAVATKQVTITETSNVLVRARAVQKKGGSPTLTIRVDGANAGSHRITSSDLDNYPYAGITLQPGTYTIGLKGGDLAMGRQVFVDVVSFPAVGLPPDTTPPEIVISGPGTYPPPEGEIANWVDSTSATVSFSANEPGVSFECWLHPGLAGNGLPTSTWTPCSSPLNFSNLPEGQKYVSVRGTDPSGNTTPGPNSQEIIWIWQVDTKAPYAQIDGAQPEVVNTNSLRVSFSAHDEIITGGTGRQTAEVRLDGGAWGAPTFSDNGGLTMSGYHDLTGLSDGRHIFEFRSTDAAGHVSNIASYSFTVDTAPSTTILSNTTKGDK